MEIKQLSHFVRVAELGSFSRAASFLNIAQPALSKQIFQLEQELKETLLIRTGRGVTLTEAGETLLAHARTILNHVGKTYEAIENIRRGKSGRVILGMPAIMSNIMAVPVIAALRTELTDAEVTVVHGHSSKLQEWLLSGQIDMALMFNTPPSPLLEVYSLGDEPLWLLGTPQFLEGRKQARLRLLTELPMIMGTRSNSVRVLLATELAKAGQALNIVFELEAFEPRVELARQGHGCTVASTWSLSSKQCDFTGLMALRLVPSDIRIAVHLVLPARRARNKLHDATFTIVRDIGRRMLHDECAGDAGILEKRL